MESMVKDNLFSGVYKNKRVLITGHTGFKGSWLAFWLKQMGAEVIGLSLAPATEPNHFNLLNCNYPTVIGNIVNAKQVQEVFDKYQPEIIFHLAAQALVRPSYEDPFTTFNTNVMGTLNILEVSRKCSAVKAIVNITSDKCYANKEWIWGYRENDPMGGYDPYSASKGCSELLTSSYQKSFLNQGDKLLASARAGNVIGGGDWAEDRLIPDMIKSASVNENVFIRSPYATRPWQHVLDPLSGYLTLGWRLLENKTEYAEGWNFGPNLESNVNVISVVELASRYWKNIKYDINEKLADKHEANLLMLDCSKANKLLKWEPAWNLDETIDKTINWYKLFYQTNKINTENDLVSYIESAKKKSLIWTM